MDDADSIKGDKLIMRGLHFYGFHGCKPEEKKLGQKFTVDIDAWVDLSEAGKTDNPDDTVDYTEIYSIVKDIVEGPSHNLLESVVHHIATNSLQKFPQISAMRVRIIKPHVPVCGHLDCLGVEIFRRQSRE